MRLLKSLAYKKRCSTPICTLRMVYSQFAQFTSFTRAAGVHSLPVVFQEILVGHVESVWPKSKVQAS